MSLKQIAIIAACAGAGFAIALVSLVGTFLWSQSRPKSWDEWGITATLDSVVFQATPAFDVQGARKEGYSDEEIFHYLQSSGSFDVEGVRRAGYSDQEILDSLQSNYRQSTPAAAVSPQLLLFHYVVYNGRSIDYRLPKDSSATVLVKRDRRLTSDERAGGKYPLFVPAGQRVEFIIRYVLVTTNDAQKKFADNRARFIAENLPQLNGFALFDEVNKVHIDFPKGW